MPPTMVPAILSDDKKIPIMIDEITSIPNEKTTSLQKISHVELLHRSQDLLNAPVADAFSSTMEGMAPVIEQTITAYITTYAIAKSTKAMIFSVNTRGRTTITREEIKTPTKRRILKQVILHFAFQPYLREERNSGETPAYASAVARIKLPVNVAVAAKHNTVVRKKSGRIIFIKKGKYVS